jgi:hypothetical protein
MRASSKRFFIISILLISVFIPALSYPSTCGEPCGALSVSGPDTIAPNSSASFVLDGAVGSVYWLVNGKVGTGGGMNGGLLTTGDEACDFLTVKAVDSCCGTASKSVKVEAGEMSLKCAAFIKQRTCPNGINKYYGPGSRTVEGDGFKVVVNALVTGRGNDCSLCRCDPANPNYSPYYCDLRWSRNCTEEDKQKMGLEENIYKVADERHPCYLTTTPGICGPTGEPIGNQHWCVQETGYLYEIVCPDCEGPDGDGTDVDGDGSYAPGSCLGPHDCDDGDPARSPNKEEICGDGIDNNCMFGADEGCCDIEALTVSPSSVAPEGTGGETSAEVTVSLKNPAPPGGCRIKLTVEPETGTGGHGHDAPNSGRPKGSVADELIINEGEEEAVVTYTSSEVAGKEKITAEMEETGEKESACVEVKVDGLTSLGGGSNLITYTSTEENHSLSNSNYGTSGTVNIVKSAVSKYAEDFGLPSDAYLAVIDMSLPWGGLFDIYGDWSPPHEEHREGTSVDFSKYYRDASGNLVSVQISRDDETGETNVINDDKLDDYFDNEGCSRKEKEEGKIHYKCN